MAPEVDDLDWITLALMGGLTHVESLVEGLERDAPDLAIDLSSWDNTMAAVEWTVIQGLTNDRVVGVPATDDDLRLVRRVHALGSAALAGGGRSPELLPLARRCLEMLRGPQSCPT